MNKGADAEVLKEIVMEGGTTLKCFLKAPTEKVRGRLSHASFYSVGWSYWEYYDFWDGRNAGGTKA